MKLLLRNSILTLGLIGLAACNMTIDKTKKDKGVNAVAGAQLSYQDIYELVFDPHCVDCHGSRGRVSVETYADTIKSLTRIERAVRLDKMPKDAPLPPMAKAALLSWIAAGAPEKGRGSEPPLKPTPEPLPEPNPEPTTPLEATYESLFFHVFEPKCVRCHSEGKSQDYLKFESYEALLSSDEIFDVENPENSEMVLRVKGENQRRIMPPARTELGALSPEEVQVLIDWIRLGMPKAEN